MWARFEETENAQSGLISQLGRLDGFKSSTDNSSTAAGNSIAFPVSRELLTATLQMVCYELYAQNAFKSAFKRLNEVPYIHTYYIHTYIHLYPFR